MPEVRDLSFGGLRLLLGALVLLALAGLGGCASSATEAKAGDYSAQFAAGRYAAAYESSSKVAGSLKAINRDQAALVAGLSARALGRQEDAKKWLTPLAINADAAMAGKACVALGSIAHDEGRHKDAADLFTRAGSRLTGDDAAHALMCAGDSWRALRRPDLANALYQQAKAKVVADQQLKIEIAERLAGPGAPIAGRKLAKANSGKPAASPPTQAAPSCYTVQTGVYSTLKRANSEARKYQAKGPTRTLQITNRAGVILYAVQVGRFASKLDADRVRKAVGNGAIVAEVVD
jgi:hypothetical protein